MRSPPTAGRRRARSVEPRPTGRHVPLALTTLARAGHRTANAGQRLVVLTAADPKRAAALQAQLDRLILADGHGQQATVRRPSLAVCAGDGRGGGRAALACPTGFCGPWLPLPGVGAQRRTLRR
ncbi:hypothetical protein GCM10010442_34840 [Kitasatospora kifunensis]